MKNAFSLAEVLITLTIIGIIGSITIPVVTQSFQNNDKLLYKKAEQTIEQSVSQLTNDEDKYPDGVLDHTFCTNLAAQINTIGVVDCDSSTVPDQPNFTSTNGMRWYGLDDLGAPALESDPDTTFLNANCDNTDTGLTGNCIKIQVDINGANKVPNTAGSDILRIYVTDQGKVAAPSGTESTYLTE